MVDEIVPAVATASITQVETAPAVTETAPSNPNPAVIVETPKEAVAQVAEVKTEVKPAEVKAEQPKPETLLGSETKVEIKTEEKPAEVKTEVKEGEIVPPKYELKAPEGFVIDENKMADVTKMFGDFEIKTKVPHEEMQGLAQQMINTHVEAMQRYTESLTQAWNKQKTDWKDSFLKDPEFANRTNTVLNAAIDVIDTFGGSKEQAQEFRNLMESTGVGNHPAVIRLLSNIKLAKPEPQQLSAPMIATNAKPSKIERMYGRKTGG